MYTTNTGTLHTVNVAVVLLLSLIFLISGLSKASGSAAGLSGTRELSVPDGFARLTGLIETLSAIALVLGFVLGDKELQRIGLVVIWFVMGGAIFFHFRVAKYKTSIPAIFLIIVTTFALATL